MSDYGYAFNSPLSWSDPSGLAPEKEKRRDRVQNFDMNEYWIGYGILQKAVAWLEDERASNYYEEMDYRQNMHFLAQSFSSRLGECGGGGGGNKAENGQTVTLTNEVKDEIQSHFKLTRNKVEEAPVEIKEKFFKALFQAYGEEIRMDDYEFLTSGIFTVNVYDEEHWKEYINQKPEDKRDGIAYTFEYELNFQEKMFTDKDFYFGEYITNQTGYTTEVSYNNIQSTIIHELGHTYAYYKEGGFYHEYNWRYRENWAIWYTNTRYRQRVGRPNEELNWSIFNFLRKGINP